MIIIIIIISIISRGVSVITFSLCTDSCSAAIIVVYWSEITHASHYSATSYSSDIPRSKLLSASATIMNAN